jgi:hypothetical protein
VGGLRRALLRSCAHAPLSSSWEEPGRIGKGAPARSRGRRASDLDEELFIIVGKLDEEKKGRENARVEANTKNRENTHGRG